MALQLLQIQKVLLLRPFHEEARSSCEMAAMMMKRANSLEKTNSRSFHIHYLVVNIRFLRPWLEAQMMEQSFAKLAKTDPSRSTTSLTFQLGKDGYKVPQD